MVATSLTSRDPMNVEVSPATLEAIQNLRELYRHEMNCQIVHDSLHARFFTDIYAIRVDDRLAGYGCVMSDDAESRDMIKEFYVLPAHRAKALPLFRRFAAAVGAEIDRGADQRHTALS